MKASRLVAILSATALSMASAWATANHEYGTDEYDTVIDGISPDGRYAITTHGGGDLGYTNFHVYLTSATTGKEISPLEEVTDNLDTNANGIVAKWSADSQSVYIVYRISRHQPLQAESYHIAHGRAFPLTKKHVDASDEQSVEWQTNGSGGRPSPKIFGTPEPNTAQPDP